MREKVLILTDSPVLPSGLGRVGREIASRYSSNKDVDVRYAGWNHPNAQHKFSYPIYPILRGSAEEPMMFAEILKGFKPDTLICIGDIWYFNHLANIPSQTLPPRRIAYITVDARPFYADWGKTLSIFTRVCVMSKFGAKEIERVFPKENFTVVYPGVDRSVFRPVKKKSIPQFKGSFMVMVNAFNSSRKNIPASIKAFEIFSKYHTEANAKMFILSKPSHYEGHNLPRMTERLGLSDSVFFDDGRQLLFGIPDMELQKYYENADCLLSTTSGEGLGLSVLEGFATKTPVIMTDYTTCDELLGGDISPRGVKIEVAEYLTGAFEMERAVASVKSTVSALSAVYSCNMKPVVERAFEFSKQFSWDKMFQQLTRDREEKQWRSV